jgi:hypothetical protein
MGLRVSKELAQCVFVSSTFQHEDVENFVQWHAGLRYFDIAFNDCDDAIALLSTCYEAGERGCR